MALYKILKTFPGSQDGRKTETFEQGTERELTPYLVASVNPAWVQKVAANKDDSNKKGDGKSGSKSK